MISAAMTIITKAIVWIAENYQLETSPDPVYTEGKGFFIVRLVRRHKELTEW